MSGPKVVRIVTREEIEAICRRHLREFDLAAERLRRRARRYDSLDARLDEDLRQRRTRLQGLFDQDRWADLQKSAPAMTAYLAAEETRIQAEAIAALEAARTRRRHVCDTARSCEMALRASGKEVPEQLLRIIKRAPTASDRNVATMSEVLGAISGELFAGEAGGGARHDAALAARLGVGQVAQSFATWQAERAAFEARDQRLDNALAVIEATEDAATVARFRERSAAILQEPSSDRRALLTDSLMFEAGEIVARRRRMESKLAQLQSVLAALDALNSPSQVRKDIQRAIESEDYLAIDSLIAKGQAVSEAETQQLAAVARRRAVLEGLAELGYEVTEGMNTAWIKDGRVILRKPGVADYGVEIGAPADASRLQVRLVGALHPKSPRSRERDRDQETIWCSEFHQLQALVGRSNGSMVIEKALEVGAVAVKSIDLGEAGGGIAEPKKEKQARSL